MKYIYTVIVLIFSITIYSQQNNRAILDANNLILEKKYNSAYKVLNGSDPNNQMPEITITKLNLLMTHHVSTELYQIFELKDVSSKKTDIKKDISNRYKFKADSILNKLKTQYPNNYQIYKALGSYYYEVRLKYPENSWILSDSTILKNIKSNYLTAYKNNVYDYWSLFGLGYVYLLEEKNDSAIHYLTQSAKLDSKYPLTYYDLAYAYSNKNDYKNSLKYGLKSYELQEIPQFKAAAALLIGNSYKELKDFENSYKYLKLANEIIPNNYDYLSALLEIELQIQNQNYKEHTLQLFLLAPNNPVIYRDILKVYKANKKLKEYVEFSEEQKKFYRNNNTTIANICFYEAIALYEDNQWVKAKLNFEKARGLFKNIFPENHNIFKVINSYTDVIKKK